MCDRDEERRNRGQDVKRDSEAPIEGDRGVDRRLAGHQPGCMYSPCGPTVFFFFFFKKKKEVGIRR